MKVGKAEVPKVKGRNKMQCDKIRKYTNMSALLV